MGPYAFKSVDFTGIMTGGNRPMTQNNNAILTMNGQQSSRFKQG